MKHITYRTFGGATYNVMDGDYCLGFVDRVVPPLKKHGLTFRWRAIFGGKSLYLERRKDFVPVYENWKKEQE